MPKGFRFREYFFVTFLVCFSASMLISCATIEGKKYSEEILGEAVAKFSMSVRWEDYKAASDYIIPASRRQFWDDMDLFQKRVRILDFEVRSISLEPRTSSADVLLRCRFYHTDDPHLNTKTVQQQWYYKEKEKVWFVTKHGLESLILANLPERVFSP